MLRIFTILTAVSAISWALVADGMGSELLEYAKTQAAFGLKSCDAKFPGGVRETAVERAKCQIEALGIMRMVTSPVGLPLLEQYFKVRMFVAEQIQAGKMTFEQGNKIITEKRGQVIAEENRILREQRQARRPMQRAQQSVQPAYQPPVQQPPIIVQQPIIIDPGPVTCIHITPMVTTCD
jgi:hypothetical protein